MLRHVGVRDIRFDRFTFIRMMDIALQQIPDYDQRDTNGLPKRPPLYTFVEYKRPVRSRISNSKRLPEQCKDYRYLYRFRIHHPSCPKVLERAKSPGGEYQKSAKRFHQMSIVRTSRSMKTSFEKWRTCINPIIQNQISCPNLEKREGRPTGVCISVSIHTG